MSPIIPVLLAGGAGTRLWPLSRDSFPKQFLPLVNGRSTFQEALLRVQGPAFGLPIVITGADCRFFASRHAEELGINASVVIEPERRDSAPAIAAVAMLAAAGRQINLRKRIDLHPHRKRTPPGQQRAYSLGADRGANGKLFGRRRHRSVRRRLSKKLRSG